MSHPTRNLLYGLTSLLVITVIGMVGYHFAGWTWSDSLYMVIISIFTVGYGEIHPVQSEFLRDFTMLLIILGCFSVIFVSGSLVQFLTEGQIRRAMGDKRMSEELKKLENHVIICGFGRIGRMVAADLKEGKRPFVIIDKDADRLSSARDSGYITLQGEATEESVLIEAGIKRAKTLATVLPYDASNVFITLSARDLNPEIKIIARGENPATERKLVQAGANRVVLPAHIGAERISHIILYPKATDLITGKESSLHLERELGDLGLKLDESVIPQFSPFIAKTIGDLEATHSGALIVVALQTEGGGTNFHPDRNTVLKRGDGIVAVSRGGDLSALLQPTNT